MRECHPINKDAWDEWVEFRTIEKRKKIGPIAEKKQLKMLSEYPPPIQQEIIDNSIMNSYQGLFPPKGGSSENNKGFGVQNQRRLSAADRVRAAAERRKNGGDEPGQVIATVDSDGGKLR